MLIFEVKGQLIDYEIMIEIIILNQSICTNAGICVQIHGSGPWDRLNSLVFHDYKIILPNVILYYHSIKFEL